MQKPSDRVGVYPGSFNPPTVAHLAIAEHALESHKLSRVVMTVSTVALGKEAVDLPYFHHRMEVLADVAAERPWLEVAATEHRLLADIAVGYDLVIMGGDKWHQIQDLRWYGNDPQARDDALATLPPVAVVPRDDLDIPAEHRLDVDDPLVPGTSSTLGRNGRLDLLVPQAREFAERTGAWVDPDRYRRWLAAERPDPETDLDNRG